MQVLLNAPGSSYTKMNIIFIYMLNVNICFVLICLPDEMEFAFLGVVAGLVFGVDHGKELDAFHHLAHLKFIYLLLLTLGHSFFFLFLTCLPNVAPA